MSSSQNGTQATTSSTPNTFLNYIDSLLDGTKWGGNVGSGATLTYSFPWSNSSSAYWASNPKYSDLNEPSSAYALSATEQAATRNALAAWANVANLNFSEITETSSNVGDLRFTWTNTTQPGAAAWAVYPNNYWASGGDAWLSAPSMGGKSASEWQSGGYNYNTLIHEIGHALGLKHPFEGETILPTNQDSKQYSMMSYTNYSDNFFRKVTANPDGSYSQNSFSWTSISPNTPMLYDIAAIQYMYGANMSYRTGDDVYTFDPNTPFYQTIWDSGGNDTISISNFSRGSTIDLRAGDYSTISFLSDPMPQGWTTTSVATYTGNNDLAIAYGAVIENAIGGAGNDTLIGNSVNNTLNGGLGTDTAVFDGNRSNYKVSKSGSNYTVNSVAEGTDTLINIELLQFKDGTYPIDSVLQKTNNTPTGSVIISGIAQQGKILTASNSLADADGLGVISYQWLSGGNVIFGVTQSNYTLTATDVGKAISVKASYTDLLGTAESMTSSATALVIGSQNTVTPTGFVKTLLSNRIFTVSDNDVNVIGGTAGNEIVRVQAGVTNVTLNANVERLELSNALSTYKFITIPGIGLEIWDASSKIATIPSLNQDTKIAFSNGTAILKQTGASDFQLGNSAISSGVATTPSNVVIDTADLSGTQNTVTPTGFIKTLLSNRIFTVSDNDVNVIGGTAGNEIVRVQSSVTNVTLNANIERLELSNALSTYKFITIPGIGLEIWNASSKIATIPSLNQDTKIAFSNGTAVLKQTGASDFQLGNAAISSGVATTPSNVVIDTTDLSTIGTTNLTGSTTINATNLIGTGTAGVDTFNIASGTYNATINGFAAGDKLVFVTGAAITVVPDVSQTDGIQVLTAADSGTSSTTTITLTGLTATQDAGVFNVNSFNTIFGAGTLV